MKDEWAGWHNTIVLACDYLPLCLKSAPTINSCDTPNLSAVFRYAGQLPNAAPMLISFSSMFLQCITPMRLQAKSSISSANYSAFTKRRGGLGLRDVPLRWSIHLFETETIHEHVLEDHGASKSDCRLKLFFES
jgi:hypothetical protein